MWSSRLKIEKLTLRCDVQNGHPGHTTVPYFINKFTPHTNTLNALNQNHWAPGAVNKQERRKWARAGRMHAGNHPGSFNTPSFLSPLGGYGHPFLTDYAYDKYQSKKQKAKKRKLAPTEEASGPSNFTDNDTGGNFMDVDPPVLTHELEEALAAPLVPLEPVPQGRGHRSKQPTWKLLQQQPVGPSPLPSPPPVAVSNAGSDSDDDLLPTSITGTVWRMIRTACNTFGLYREYPIMPTYNPDDFLGLDDYSDAATVPTTAPEHVSPLSAHPAAGAEPVSNPYHPFKNSTVHGLMEWSWTGSAMKSLSEVARLITFLKSDKFKKEDLEDFDVRSETAKFDKHLEGALQDGWKESEVTIQVPDGKPHSPGSIPTFSVSGLFHRSLVQVITSTVQEASARFFHYTPFRSFWKTEDKLPQQIFDKLYSSDVMLDAHAKLQSQPCEPGCTLERVVLGLMLWSDSTHLASFGSASLWPIYLFFGNQSKWTRVKPTTNSCHHIVYIPKLPDSFHDFFVELTGQGPTADILTHCRRELMHAVWQCLLDAEFLEVYKHGIVIECPDGIRRRFYLRIFTYSADYPEKVLLATIRNLGSCPCPTCLIPKEKIPEVGQKLDNRCRTTTRHVDDECHHWTVKIAREFIYEKDKGVKSAAVERLLAKESLVPTTNAFSCLPHFNFFRMLVPDFMHEFELAVQALNTRYRQVPTFGRSTIRRFTENASSMKKLAARNYEDLLQCAIPVFDGLLPEEHNDTLLSLLFTLAEWHCLGKLRLHTDMTIGWLEQCTANLGKQLRHFQKYTCSFFETQELPKEEAARSRCRKKAASSRTRQAGSDRPAQSGPSASSANSKAKGFNLIMYKLHALGDYVRNIKLFGTSDSYSTQPGELEHRRVKKYYVHTNKNRAVRQMTR
ncbi:hypothetical protein BDZ97DRAFT_1922371 [Flammula alnicola]|nr:hypothetical protein BDZ97DRAFT_1922371 [Flammula alnicola]